MKTICVTGGAGFIGSNAIAYLLKKHPDYTIINLDKMTYAASADNMIEFMNDPRHIFVKGDICDRPLVDQLFGDYQISDVIHFAAESHVDNSIAQPDIFLKTNIMGTFTLLDVAKAYWKQHPENRFHHISTDEVYGSLGAEGHFTEDSQYAPNSPYSASKASSDHLVRSYHRTYGLNTVMTHCSNNYGPHQHAEKFIPTVIRKALAGESIPIYGNGQNVRDWLFVEDHCRAIDAVFHQAKAGDHFNVGGLHEMSNIQLARKICEILDQRKSLESGKSYTSFLQFVNDRAGHDFRYAVGIDKIQLALGWTPTMTFTQGLVLTIDHYLKRFSECKDSTMSLERV